MKVLNFTFGIVLLALLSQTACQSPAHTVYSAGTALHTANQAMIAAFKEKKIDRDQFEAYVAASRAATAALVKLDDARLTGDTAKVEDLLRVANAELAKALLIRLNALGEK